MGTLVYLDVDDEITSAAARMRGADEGRVGLVVPYGSRLATSRINFRLLAREAQARGRQLAIVASDNATRALAASAGLPVFSSVGEYETALADGTTSDDGERGRSEARGDGGAGGGGPASRAADAATAAVDPVAPTPEGRGKAADLAETAVVAAPPRQRAPEPTREPAVAIDTHPDRARTADNRSIPLVGALRRPLGRTPVLVGAAALVLLLLAGGVAAYVFLPSATVTVTPRLEPVGPAQIEVTADPSADSVDTTAGVIPAQRLTFAVEAADTFETTGKRVEQSKAKGSVTFENYDPTAANTIPAGSIVSTEGGIRFRTVQRVVIPPGQFVLPSVVPGKASVAIEAVDAGPKGNVPENTIRSVPRGENATFTRVTNPDATSGGKRDEFPRVAQQDVDRAMEELTKQVGQQFEEQLADPSSVPEGMTLFADTKTLSDPVPSVDPASLVGQEVESFDLSLTAEGSVTAVDETPLTALAQSRIASAVEDGHRLVDGSVETAVGDPRVDGEQVVFPVVARAQQVAEIDADRLLAQIKGRPLPEARSILEAYGHVDIATWPDWVTAIPTIDGRVDLTIAGAEADASDASSAPSGGTAPSGSPVASAAP